MENNNNNKRNIAIAVVGIIILVVVTIGVSFAYFSATSISSSQNIKTGQLKLEATSSKLNATGINPTVWSSVIANNVANTDIAQVMLSVNTYGTTVDRAKYDIYLTTSGISLNTSEELTGGSLSDIKWKLVDASNSIIGFGDFTDGNYTTATKITNNPITIQGNIDNKEDAIQTYILFIYIEDNGQQDQLQDLNISATMSAKSV